MYCNWVHVEQTKVANVATRSRARRMWLKGRETERVVVGWRIWVVCGCDWGLICQIENTGTKLAKLKIQRLNWPTC